jgi:hypothetical protein
VGEEGAGLWLLFSQENEEGTPVKYERCSTPDKECAGKISNNVARDYLSLSRRGKTLLGTCHRHAVSPRFLLAAAEAQFRHEIDATAQPQNGNSAKHDKPGPKPKPADDFIADVYAVIDELLALEGVAPVADAAPRIQLSGHDLGEDGIRKKLKRKAGVTWEGAVSQRRKILADKFQNKLVR